MKYQLALSLAALVLSGGFSGAQIQFGPLVSRPGESVRMVSHSETPGGTTERTLDGRTTRGTLSITRDRDLVWTFRPLGADGTRRGMVKVNQLTTATKTGFGGKEDTVNDPSPLTGKLFSMTKAPAGDWKFELDGSVPLSRVRDEIEEMTHYLKREWYPTKPVKLGDSWEFDPQWVKTIIQRDLKNAKTIGTMRLKQVRRSQDRQVAVIEVNIRSTGGDFKADGTESAAAIDLAGEMSVNLTTMLDETLELKGKLVSSTGTATSSTKVTLPVNLRVTKTFVSDP